MKQEGKIQSRVFLVGCPRSGSTLLQSLLARHSMIISFPESHIFGSLFPTRPLYRRMGFASRRARRRFDNYVIELGQPDMRQLLPVWAILRTQYIKAFVELLDLRTQQFGGTIWLEKTPRHLHYIEYIERTVEQTRFIHIVRNGPDVVASMFDLSNKYPAFWGYFSDIDVAIERWLQDIRISLKYIGDKNHSFVSYERLVADPRYAMNGLCRFLEIPFETEMVDKNHSSLQTIALDREHWKLSVSGPIENRNNRKFYEVFNVKEQEYVLNRLAQSKSDVLEFKLA